jgi:putative redox protein
VGLKTATLTLEGEGLRFVARAASGHSVVLDDMTGDAGMRPSELIPIAIAGCTALDVISILRKKQQTVTSYEVRASGEQADLRPNAFVRIDVVHILEGEALDVEAVRRAIELSVTKYCAVGATLSSGMTEIHHAYLVRDGNGEELMAEVIVTGPFERPAIATPPAVGAAALPT